MFPIRPKCLRWFSLCFRGLFGQFRVALKTIYLVGCLWGTLVVTKVLAFSSHPRVLATLMRASERSRTWSSLAFIENYRGRFIFIPKVLGVPFFNQWGHRLFFSPLSVVRPKSLALKKKKKKKSSDVVKPFFFSLEIILFFLGFVLFQSDRPIQYQETHSMLNEKKKKKRGGGMAESKYRDIKMWKHKLRKS